MLATEQVRSDRAPEARTRRALARDGYRLTKCRRGYGGYGVINNDTNFILFGLSADNRGYDASLDEVEHWVSN